MLPHSSHNREVVRVRTVRHPVQNSTRQAWEVDRMGLIRNPRGSRNALYYFM